jgi:hypothetical protein
MKILAFESTCDETAVAIVEDGRHILTDQIFSQADLHAVYGGVVPEIASRCHVESISISVYPYGYDNDNDRWFSFTFHSGSERNWGSASVWDGEFLPFDEQKYYKTVDEMIEAIIEVGKKGVKDGQTE